MKITYSNKRTIDTKSLEELYTDAQWTAYTKDLHQLHQAVLQSYDVISAWDEERLVGLVRTVSDGLTIVYIQDILVLNSYQNKGIASTLMQKILAKHTNVRQKVLLTEDAPNVRHFYEKNGFTSCDQGEGVAFAQFNMNA